MNDLSERLEVLSGILGRCALLGFGLLLIWCGVMVWGGGIVYRMAQSLGVAPHECALIVFGLLGATKIAILLFFLIPYIAIRLTFRRRRLRA
ncbi:MAG TPA: hypothetical protein VMU17_06660 [Elusimicrobiota bacterium]|nr:hypothetical protein [Elusimicrobiota bacterium]